jgi:hypothetical protein
MPSVLNRLFRRPPGTGWLILSGGPMPEDLLQRALALVDHAGILLAVAPTPPDLQKAENALQPWLDATGWEGRTVDCESSDVLEEALSEAALVVLPDLADSAAYARQLGQTDACEYLLAALDDGAVIVAEGPAAEALGDHFASGQNLLPGLRWVPGAVVQSHFVEDQTPTAVGIRKESYRIGLPAGVAIALGPGEEREIWGVGQPTITFREWWKT